MRSFKTIIVLVLLTLLPLAALAESHKKEQDYYLAFGLGGGINQFSGTSGIPVGEPLVLNGRVGRSMYWGKWMLEEEVQVEGTVGNGFDVGAFGTKLNINTVTTTANTRLTTPALFTLPMLGDTKLFALGGIGFTHASFDVYSPFGSASASTDDFAGRVGGGLRFNPAEKFDLTVEVSEVFNTGSLSGLDYTSITANVIWSW